MTERLPLLGVVEDLQWIGPSTLELLNLLIDQVPTVRLFRVPLHFSAFWIRRANEDLQGREQLTGRSIALSALS
jgi:predicted ATPase